MPGTNKDWFSKVILMKLETTEGTDAAPTVGANALRVLNYQPQFMDADQKVRNIEKAFFGADPVAMAAFKRGATFDMEIHGGGNANGLTIPPWMTPLQIAGFGAPVVGASSVSISPITSGIKSATHYGYIDDLLMIAIGGRASVGFTITDDEFPLFNFNYLGRPPAALASQVVPGNPTITGYIDPVLACTENTTITIDGYACGVRSFTMNSNSDLQFRSLINPLDRVNYRNRGWNGQLVIEIPDLTTKDYFQKVKPSTPGTAAPTMVAQVVHGVVAGNIVQIDIPKLQITGNIELSEEQGKTMGTFPVTALPNTGNDEIVFTSK